MADSDKLKIKKQFNSKLKLKKEHPLEKLEAMLKHIETLLSKVNPEKRERTIDSKSVSELIIGAFDRL